FGFPGFWENQPFSVLAIGATPTSAILNAPRVACGVDWIKSGLAIQLDEMAYLCNRVLDLGSLRTAATINPIRKSLGRGAGCCAGLPGRDGPCSRKPPSGRN